MFWFDDRGYSERVSELENEINKLKKLNKELARRLDLFESLSSVSLSVDKIIMLEDRVNQQTKRLYYFKELFKTSKVDEKILRDHIYRLTLIIDGMKK